MKRQSTRIIKARVLTAVQRDEPRDSQRQRAAGNERQGEHERHTRGDTEHFAGGRQAKLAENLPPERSAERRTDCCRKENGGQERRGEPTDHRSRGEMLAKETARERNRKCQAARNTERSRKPSHFVLSPSANEERRTLSL